MIDTHESLTETADALQEGLDAAVCELCETALEPYELRQAAYDATGLHLCLACVARHS